MHLKLNGHLHFHEYYIMNNFLKRYILTHSKNLKNETFQQMQVALHFHEYASLLKETEKHFQRKKIFQHGI